MALNLQEEATLKLKADTGQFNTDIKQIDDRAKELSKTLQQIEKTGPGKGSEEWKKYKLELDETRKAGEALRKQVDISTLSYGQLDNYVKQLARDLKTLRPGTEEFIAASAKLQNARNYLDQVTASTKANSAASKQATKDLTAMADSGLKFGELKIKIDQLKARLETLSPDTQEFIDTAKQLAGTQLYYNQVDKSIKDISASTKLAAKDLTTMADSGLTFGELKTKVEQLKAKLDTLNPTSKEFIATSKQLASVEAYYDEIRQSVDEATASMHRQLLEANNSTLTYGQLESKVKLLAERIKTLKPGTEEFIKAGKDLHQTEQDFAAVTKEAEHLRKTGEQLGAPSLWDRVKTSISSLSLVGAASLTGLAMAVKTALGTAIEKFDEYDAAAADMSAVTGITGKSLDYLAARAMETGPAVGKSAAEMMDAYKLLASAKPELAKNAEALAMVTDQAIRLSKAGKIDLSQAADLVGESLNQWGQGAGKAAEYVDVLAAGSLEGSATMGNLSSSLKYAGTVASAAGISFTQTNAVLQSLSMISIKGEQAGTGLRTMLIKLMSGAKDTNPAIVGLDKALENLEKKNLSAAQMTKLFGAENLVTARHVITHRQEIAQMTKNMTGTDVATKQAKTNMATLGETIKQGTATVTNYAVSLGQKLAPAVTMSIQYGMAFLKVLAGTPQFLLENRGLILGLATGLVFFNAQLIISSASSLKAAAIEKLRGVAATIAAAADKVRAAEAARKAAAEALATAATEAGTVAENASTVASGRRTIAERLQAAQATIMAVLDKGRIIVTNALTIAQNALNVAMRANPIGLVIGVLTILVGVFYTVYENNVKVRAAFSGLWAAMKAGVTVIVQLWQAVKNLDFDSVATQMRQASTQIANAFTTGYDERIASELPKSAKKAGTAAGKALTETHTAALNTMTAEDEKAAKAAEKARKKSLKDQQDHLDDVKKANEKALEDLAKLEADAHIAGIKDEMQREFVKLMAKRDLAAEEILRGIQDKKYKDAQIKALDKTLEEDIARVAGEFAEKKRKKAEEAEHQRLETMKDIAEQERTAKNALFDWEEIQAGTNAVKLADIHKRRVAVDLQATISKLDAEENAEKQKASREITDKTLLKQALTAIENRYIAERKVAGAQYSADVERTEKELKEKKQAIWGATSNAFSSLLKGDVMAFVESASQIVQGEKSAWQKRLSENEAKYAAVAQMAQAAAQFLADLEKRKAEKAIAEAQRERDEKVRLLNDQIAAEKAAQDAAESEKQRVTQDSNDKISAIKSATESTISGLEQQYRQLSSREEKKKVDEQLAGYKESADEKGQAAKDTAEEAIEAAQSEAKASIEAAQKTEKETIKAAQNEKEQKIDAAEAARDAEIAAINKRSDIDSETRKKLLAEAKDKFEQEKKLAQDEATDKIDKAKLTAKTQTDLAKDAQKTKIELAQDQRDAELKAIDAVQKGDLKAAKEILANAKTDQKEKIRLAKEQAEKAIEEAEKEKREKLKKVEAEKQLRIQNQKELNRSIEAENARAKAKEVEAKRQAWKAQQKADIASALIAGALATIKALASSFWPANLVFAAMSAVMTGIQIVKIKSQPEPVFEQGGFIPQGPRHHATYGRGGIGLIDNQTGRNVGEMEGGEAIISREQTQANMPLIQRMFANARTAGRRSQSVLGDRDALGRPAGFRDGGLFDQRYWKQEMFLYGGIKRGRRYEDGGEFVSDSGGGDTGGGGDGISNANSEYEESKKQFQEQLKQLTAIKEAVEKDTVETKAALGTLDSNVRQTINQTAQNQAWAQAMQALRIATALESLQSATKAGLDSLGQTSRQGFDGLNRNLILALLRSSVSQTNDTERLITALTNSGAKVSSELVAAIRLGSAQTVTAIGQARLTNQLALTSVALRISDGFERSITSNRADIGDLTQNLEFFLDDLGSRAEQAVDTLGDRTERSLDRFRLTNQVALTSLSLRMSDGFERLLARADTNLDELTQHLEYFIDTLGDRTEDAVDRARLANQLALSTLSRTTSTSLDKLATTTATSLTRLEKSTVRALDDLADRSELALALLDEDVVSALSALSKATGLSLDQLKRAVTKSLDELNRDQTFMLTRLGDQTEAALNRSTDRTTGSVDSLSVEVRSLKGSINAVEGAVWQVKNATDGVQGAVWGSNQAGRLDALIAAISTLS